MEDIRSGKINLVEKLQDYRLHMVSRGIAPSTVRRYNNGLKKWFGVNRIKVDWSEIDYMPPLPKNGSVIKDRTPTVEELRKIMTAANLKMRALI